MTPMAHTRSTTASSTMPSSGGTYGTPRSSVYLINSLLNPVDVDPIPPERGEASKDIRATAEPQGEEHQSSGVSTPAAASGNKQHDPDWQPEDPKDDVSQPRPRRRIRRTIRTPPLITRGAARRAAEKSRAETQPKTVAKKTTQKKKNAPKQYSPDPSLPSAPPAPPAITPSGEEEEEEDERVNSPQELAQAVRQQASPRQELTEEERQQARSALELADQERNQAIVQYNLQAGGYGHLDYTIDTKLQRRIDQAASRSGAVYLEDELDICLICDTARNEDGCCECNPAKKCKRCKKKNTMFGADECGCRFGLGDRKFAGQIEKKDGNSSKRKRRD